jgi:hypothetical protein
MHAQVGRCSDILRKGSIAWTAGICSKNDTKDTVTHAHPVLDTAANMNNYTSKVTATDGACGGRLVK